MVQELKDKLVPKINSYSFSNGSYVAGKDFVAGIYNIKATSGGGNMSSDNMYDGGINAIMGVDGDPDFYQREYKNISLPEGTTLTISDITIRLTVPNKKIPRWCSEH